MGARQLKAMALTGWRAFRARWFERPLGLRDRWAELQREREYLRARREDGRDRIAIAHARRDQALAELRDLQERSNG